MNEHGAVAMRRQELLEEVRERMKARLATVEMRLLTIQDEIESLALERVELEIKLRVLNDQMQCQPGASGADDQ
jgi:hypothetical protein